MTHSEIVAVLVAHRKHCNKAVNDRQFIQKITRGGNLPRAIEKFLLAIECAGYQVTPIKPQQDERTI